MTRGRHDYRLVYGVLVGLLIGVLGIGFAYVQWGEERQELVAEVSRLKERLQNTKSLSWQLLFIGMPVRNASVVVKDARGRDLGQFYTDDNGFLVVTVNGTLGPNCPLVAQVRLTGPLSSGNEEWAYVLLPIDEWRVEVVPQ